MPGLHIDIQLPKDVYDAIEKKMATIWMDGFTQGMELGLLAAAVLFLLYLYFRPKHPSLPA